MKPLKLELEGFTSFRDRLLVDFSDLDLFAITGPTGAGKSSLIDAVVFALYGQVPRVGDDYKQLISHGAERLSVLFEFGVGGDAYRIARTSRKTGASQQRLERRSAKGWEPVADRVRDIRAEVERLLGLDYDGFTRSVVLPQGQFDAFLKGEPKERRKILVALLGLEVYERMQQLANQRQAAARTEADFIRRQLETDFAGATPEGLEQQRAELAGAEAEDERARAELAALGEAASLAQAARAARREGEALARDGAEESEALAAAQATLEGAGDARRRLEADLDEARQRLEALGFDEARHATLLGSKPQAEQLAALQPRLDRAATALAGRRKALAEAEAARRSSEAALPAAEHAETRARERLEAAREVRESAHREHAAVALRRALKPGDPCPVCAQAVKALPSGEAPGLDAVEEAARVAEAEARGAADRRQQERVRVEGLRSAAESLAREVAQLEEHHRDAASSAETLRAELLRSGFGLEPPAGPSALVARIQAELQKLEAARRTRAELEARRLEIEQERAALDASVAAAAARKEAALGRTEALAARREAARLRLDEARRSLLASAVREGWADLEALPPGLDEVDAIERRRAGAQATCSESAARVAALRQTVEATGTSLVRAAELRARRAALEAEASLHKTLADHLKANELVAWIQEEALQRLASEGSRHLAKLSQGRYALRLGSGEGERDARAEQDFFVVDHWNGDSVRSVKTLSGGETFLASLALALALAESLAQLSSEARAAEALESLFLDEGFGTLDGETLDVVVSALDALHGGQRMVGIVTHVRDLAERLPARLEIRRQGSASTAVVV